MLALLQVPFWEHRAGSTASLESPGIPAWDGIPQGGASTTNQQRFLSQTHRLWGSRGELSGPADDQGQVGRPRREGQGGDTSPGRDMNMEPRKGQGQGAGSEVELVGSSPQTLAPVLSHPASTNIIPLRAHGGRHWLQAPPRGSPHHSIP